MVAGVGIAMALLLNVFRSNIQLFYTPTEVAEGVVPAGVEFRVGGLVAANSVKREGDGLTVDFEITDNARQVPVRYTGILPDLFKEGQGTVSVGTLDADGVFIASKVLAKHDENYMPPEAAEALERSAKKSKHGSSTVIMQ